MSDLISRQAAIDAIKGLPTWWADAGGYYGDAQPPMEALLDPEDAVSAIENLPSAQPEIIYCKDCVKHNKARGYYYDGTVIGIKDCCPLVEIRGKAQGHEFDYQFCAYAKRRTDG